MVDVITNNMERIIETCKKMQVESLYLFGSGTNSSKFNEESDLDFLFRFKKNEEGISISDYDYFDLMFTLEEITGKKVDLVAEEKLINKYFINRLNKEKIKLYES